MNGIILSLLMSTVSSWSLSLPTVATGAFPSVQTAEASQTSEEEAIVAPAPANDVATAEPEVLMPVEDELGADVPDLAENPISAKPVVFADLSNDEVFAKAVASIESIETMRASFSQFAPSGNVSTGKVSLSRPGRLRFDYEQPSAQLIVAVGGLVYVHDAELETTDTYPVSETPLRFLLDKELDLDAARLSDVYRTDEGVAVFIQPTDNELQGELALIFSAPDMQLKEWAVFEPSGDVTRVALSDVETGVKLPGRLFRAPDSGGSFLRD